MQHDALEAIEQAVKWLQVACQTSKADGYCVMLFAEGQLVFAVVDDAHDGFNRPISIATTRQVNDLAAFISDKYDVELQKRDGEMIQ